MKTIGIIGGMSYESSIHYYERINNQVNELVGGLTCAKMIIYNVNFEDIRKMMLSNEWDKIGVELAAIAKTLENAGADYIVIATNTMHKLADYVQSQINIPLIHIADCVADKCKESNISNVGLLGTKYTMVEDFLKNRLRDNGLTVITPQSEENINEIDRIIFDELCKGKIRDTSREYYIKVINNMIQQNDIKGVILGCTEIEMLVKQADLDIPIFDTTQSHIDSIVDYSLERRVIMDIDDINSNNLTKYRKIIEKYKNGEYGCEHLNLNEILSRAGEPDLLRQMNLEELDELINNSFGMYKELFIMIKNERIAKEKNRTGLVKKMNTNNK